MVMFAVSGCNTSIEAGAAMVRLAIEKVEGLDAEFEKVKIGSCEYRCVTEEWVEGLMPGIVQSLSDTVNQISHLNEREKVKLDFIVASD
jgi:hypothetical protein